MQESDLSHQSGLNSLRTASARKPSTWSGTTEAPGLDALLHAFSPAKGAGGAGTFFSNPSEEDSTAAYNEEALFGGGSSSHTPTRPSGSLMASPQPAMFDATVGSPGSSLRPTAANLISQVGSLKISVLGKWYSFFKLCRPLSLSRIPRWYSVVNKSCSNQSYA